MDETPEGTARATKKVAEMAAVEVTRAAPAVAAKETASAMVEVQAAMDMAFPGAKQAIQTRIPALP